jgi:peptide deformylase
MGLWHLRSSFTTVLLQRPDTVKINAQDVSGAKIKVKLSQLSARVFQHEFDHLLVRAEP